MPRRKSPDCGCGCEAFYSALLLRMRKYVVQKLGTFGPSHQSIPCQISRHIVWPREAMGICGLVRMLNPDWLQPKIWQGGEPIATGAEP